MLLCYCMRTFAFNTHGIIVLLFAVFGIHRRARLLFWIVNIAEKTTICSCVSRVFVCVCIRWSQREFCFSSSISGVGGCGNSNDVKVHWTNVHAWLWSVRNYDILNQRSLNFNIQQKQYECYSIRKDSLTLTHNISDFYVNIDLCSYFDSVVQ